MRMQYRFCSISRNAASSTTGTPSSCGLGQLAAGVLAGHHQAGLSGNAARGLAARAGEWLPPPPCGPWRDRVPVTTTVMPVESAALAGASFRFGRTRPPPAARPPAARLAGSAKNPAHGIGHDFAHVVHGCISSSRGRRGAAPPREPNRACQIPGGLHAHVGDAHGIDERVQPAGAGSCRWRSPGFPPSSLQSGPGRQSCSSVSAIQVGRPPAPVPRPPAARRSFRRRCRYPWRRGWRSGSGASPSGGGSRPGWGRKCARPAAPAPLPQAGQTVGF